MITQPAIVVAETDDSYIVKTLPRAVCPRCDAGKGCGAGIFVKFLANKTYQLAVKKDRPLRLKSNVTIGINSSVLLMASTLLYLLPLLSLLAGAIITAIWINSDDFYTLIGAFVGMGFGVLFAKLLSKVYLKDMGKGIILEADSDGCFYQAN